MLRLFILAFLGLGVTLGFAQTPPFHQDSLEKIVETCPELKNKKIPTKKLEDQVRIVLSFYPELAETRIQVKLKKKQSPLSARPSILSLFRKKSKRLYYIIISTKPKKIVEPIQFENLSFNAQIGVLGHELSHIAEYQSKNSTFFVQLFFKQFNARKLDVFEFETDRRCIEHGLGKSLLIWSKEVREKLNIEIWGGSSNLNPKHERYMNPTTIMQEMEK